MRAVQSGASRVSRSAYKIAATESHPVASIIKAWRIDGGQYLQDEGRSEAAGRHLLRRCGLPGNDQKCHVSRLWSTRSQSGPPLSSVSAIPRRIALTARTAVKYGASATRRTRGSRAETEPAGRDADGSPSAARQDRNVPVVVLQQVEGRRLAVPIRLAHQYPHTASPVQPADRDPGRPGEEDLARAAYLPTSAHTGDSSTLR